MAIAAKCTISGKDFQGNSCKMSFFTDTAVHALALADAVNTASNAKLTQVTGYNRQVLTDVKDDPSSDDFSSGQQKAVIIMQASVDLSTHKYEVPAPVTTIFEADGITLSKTGNAADLITAFETYAMTALESATLTFVRGHLGFRKSRKY